MSDDSEVRGVTSAQAPDPRQRVRVLVRGYYGAGNFGDDCLLAATCGVLLRLVPPASLAVACRVRPYVRALAPGATLVADDATALRADLLLFGGGTQFFSFPGQTRGSRALPSPAGLQVALLTRRLLRWSRRHLPWRLNRFKASAGLGIGVGPFVPGSREEVTARGLLRSMAFLAVRDEGSLRTCRQWGCSRAQLFTDLCFLPGIWKLPAPRPPAPGRPAVAAIVRDWPHQTEGAGYEPPLQDAVRHLRSRGVTVRYVLLSPADSWWQRELSRLGEDAIVWDPERSSIGDFLGTLSGFDVLATARYHGAVFGTLLGKPVVCIEIEQKLRLAASAMGEHCALWRRPFGAGELTDLVLAAAGEGYGLRAQQAVRAAALHGERAAAMAAEFVRFLSEGGASPRSEPAPS